MTATSSEFQFDSPFVELHHGLDLSPVEIAALTAANATTDPENSWREALLSYRVFAIRKLRDELLNKTVVDDTLIRRTADTMWQLFSPVFKKATGPMIAEAYIRAFRAVEQGDVPIQLIYALADEHADRVGKYFNDTSTDALIQGFNTYVNKQVPQRAAIERVIDAYGLTPRQMSGLTAADALSPIKMATAVPQAVKQKTKSYIGKSIADRINVFKRQEAHNLDEQAKQVAWLWLVENGKLPKTAQKMWLTAKDEKVCAQCGPMNGKKVLVGEKFELPNGNQLFVPGAHVNCRCQVRLQMNPFEEVGKAEEFDPKAHPRGAGGRFVSTPDQLEEQERRVADLQEQLRSERAQRQQARREPTAAPVAEAEVTVPTPMEEMVRQAREAAEQERLRRIEEAIPTEAPPEAKPRASFAGPKPRARFTEAPAAKPKATFQVPEAEAPKPRAAFAAPVPEEEVPKPRAAFAPAPEAAKPRAEFPKPRMGFDYEELVRIEEERWSAQQRAETLHPEEVIYRPTRRVRGRGNVPQTGYVVVGGPEKFTPWQESLLLDDEDQIRVIPAVEKPMWIRNQVRDMYNRNITEKHQQMMGGRTEYEIRQTALDDEGRPIPGTDLVAYIESEDVLRAIELSLLIGEKDKPRYVDELDSAGAASVELSWMNEQTGEVEFDEVPTWREVTEYLNLDPDEYRVVLASMVEIYRDAARIDDETWSSPGSYIVTAPIRDAIEVEGKMIPYERVRALPDVRERRVTEYGRREPPEDLPHDRYDAP